MDTLTNAFNKADSRFHESLNSSYENFVSNLATTDPARASQLTQGGNGYFGVDAMENMQAGSAPSSLASSPPGAPSPTANYSVPGAPTPSMTSADFHGSVQVGPSTAYPNAFRENVSQVAFDPQLPYSSGTAGANPQFGPGGSTQYFQVKMATHNPAPFGGASPSMIPIDPTPGSLGNYAVRTMEEAVGMRVLLHAPIRITAYTHFVSED